MISSEKIAQIKNTYQKVTLGDGGSNCDVNYGSVQLPNGVECPVTILGCPYGLPENSQLIAAINKGARKGRVGGNFITSSIHDSFMPVDISEARLFAYLGDPMGFIDIVPGQGELEEYFSHTNLHYLYMGNAEGKLFCIESTYDKKTKKWLETEVGVGPKQINRSFGEFEPEQTRILFLQEDKTVRTKFEQMRNCMQPLIELERIDNMQQLALS